MNTIRVHEETSDDIGAIRDVEIAAFGQTLQTDIVDQLRRSADPQLSLVATVDDQIVGHVFFSPASIQSRPAVPVAQLSPLAVTPSHQGRGVGSALAIEGLARCLALDWRLVFLLGDPAYYAPFGFQLAAPMGVTFGDKAAEPALQVVEVEPGALRGPGGLVRFNEAFDMAETAQ